MFSGVRYDRNAENVPPLVLLPPVSLSRPHSPSSKPALASQRDHSACSSFASPLVVRKHRDNDQPEAVPPCHVCDGKSTEPGLPTRQLSVSRRMLKAVKTGMSRSNASAKTLTNSTASTTELCSDFESKLVLPSLQIESADEEHTDEALPMGSELDTWSARLSIPYMDLEVVSEVEEIAAEKKQDIWIAVRASVASHAYEVTEAGVAKALRGGSLQPATVMGVPSVRLIIQPAPRHRILQTLGHKILKHLKLGEQCEMFVRLRVPRYQPPPETETELATAITDLESVLGVLESEVLHVEARYKHALIDKSNSDLRSLTNGQEDAEDAKRKQVVRERMSKWIEEHASTLGPPWM